jgi:glycosyltransferase involved in cell wall biosynthesis
MHIFIAALHRPSKPTGVCRYASNLARCLADLQEVNQITIVIGKWQKHYFESWLNCPKINLISIDIPNHSLARNIWFLLRLPKLVKNLNPDIVHLAFPLPFLRPLFSLPIVCTIHDLYPYESPEVFGYPNVIFNRLFLKLCIQNSHSFICVSQSTLKSLKFYFPKLESSKVMTCIYNYVDLSEFILKKPEKLQLKEKNPFWLCVAQHRKNKNIDLLIQVFSYLRDNQYIKNVNKLIIVGSTGPETENLQQQICSLALEHQIFLLNSIKDSELCWLYKNCQVFIAPSSQEGFCLPLAEAMHFSCKIVCSNIPIFKEIGSPDCFYFDLEENQLPNLAKAIINCLENTVHKSSIDFRFSKANIAEQYLIYYTQIMGVK